MLTRSAVVSPITTPRDDQPKNVEIAVLVPCFNEAATIANVVRDFRAALPEATIYVFDNNSTDDTVEEARRAGAVVRTENRQGKGHVVRRMFTNIEADIYILVDGDDTYEADAAPRMVNAMIDEGLDMVTGVRRHKNSAAYRAGHQFGNKLLTGLVEYTFNARFQDMLSGYRAFSRRFVKSFPMMARGFEVETEFTIHALELNMPIGEIDTHYGERPPGSVSKLNTIGDGIRILSTIALIMKQERPMMVFGLVALALFLLCVVLLAPVATTYFMTGLVPRMPTVVIASALLIIAMLSTACGLILDTVTRGRQEAKRIAYLAIPGVLHINPPAHRTPAADETHVRTTGK
ncbi:glycosyltransferase [Parvularcula flava]|uniref:Glycosyl transferase n=1 Tax=Aquisalinus luteolus TaxID=1566827 RepID=A0A8J3A9N5_9PROT|nr:glycosyltransferase [Aquisalinus luteolus]NHK29539.1 glycosyltransferase [Aquisalinus luteolus]GGI01634.1 glycosyl transferase [Aquisalinus luteolus]